MCYYFIVPLLPMFTPDNITLAYTNDHINVTTKTMVMMFLLYITFTICNRYTQTAWGEYQLTCRYF